MFRRGSSWATCLRGALLTPQARLHPAGQAYHPPEETGTGSGKVHLMLAAVGSGSQAPLGTGRPIRCDVACPVLLMAAASRDYRVRDEALHDTRAFSSVLNCT